MTSLSNSRIAGKREEEYTNKPEDGAMRKELALCININGVEEGIC